MNTTEEERAVSILDAAIRQYVATVSGAEGIEPGPVTHWALAIGFLPDATRRGTPCWVISPTGQQGFITSGLLHVAQGLQDVS